MFFLTAVPGTVDISSLELGVLEVFLRLLCAMVVGMVIGIEREYTHRPAGMRTHILVALGACVVMVVGQMIFTQYSALGAMPDPARLSAQVISGVGFLGAGTILREGANVKGLTTAASLWAVAGLGIAAGAGYYAVALIGMVFMFITLTVFEFLQKALISPHSGNREYTVDTNDVAMALKAINELAAKAGCEIRHIEAANLADGTYRVTFRAEFGKGKQKSRRVSFFQGLTAAPGVRMVRSSDEAVTMS